MTIDAKSLTVGVIGLGRMGLRHVEVVAGLGMQVIGLADINPEAIDTARIQFGLAQAQGFTDPLRMIAELKPDALVIATTAPYHAASVMAAAEAGVKLILCEKAMGISIAECEAMIAVCKARGVKLAVNHQMRFMEQNVVVKELAESAALGGLTSMALTCGNIGLAMNGSHYFEMFRYLTETPIDRVSAWFEAERLPNPRGAQFDDASGRVIGFNAEGQSIFMDFSARAGWGVLMNFVCRNGQIVLDSLLGDMVVKAREAEHRDLSTSRYGMPVTTTLSQVPASDSTGPTRDVWLAMLEGRDYPTGEDGLHAIKCLVAAHMSNERNGATVTLEETAAWHDRSFNWA
jgi:predicted dehydrogenase